MYAYNIYTNELVAFEPMKNTRFTLQYGLPTPSVKPEAGYALTHAVTYSKENWTYSWVDQSTFDMRYKTVPYYSLVDFGMFEPQGPHGPKGDKGDTGERGPQGLPGDTGPMGPIGLTGATGPQGIQGEQGPQGLQGNTGPQGIQGVPGEKGTPGTSVSILGSYNTYEQLIQAHPTGIPGNAYMINPYLYVWNNITYTWDNVGRIQGPKGDAGIQGPIGPEGPQGVQGPQGQQGVAGLTVSVNNVPQVDGNITLSLDTVPDGSTRRIPTTTSNLTNDSGFLTSVPIATSSVAGLVKSGTDISVDTLGNVSVLNDSHDHTKLSRIDDNDRKPNATSKNYMEAVFTSLGGLTGTANGDFQDMIVLNTGADATGGKVNALVFDKSEMKIRHYQASQTATTWGTPKEIAYVDAMDEKYKRHIITAKLNLDYIVTANSTYQPLILSQEAVVGTKLNIVDNKIKIGAGVSYIMANAEASLVTNDTGAGTKYLTITKNGVNYRLTHFKAVNSDILDLIITPTLIPVVENDIIGLSVYGLIGDYYVSTYARTHLTVEVVNV